MTERLIAGVDALAWAASMVGAVLLLVEWVAGSALTGFPFRTGVPFIRRVLPHAGRGLPPGRQELARVTLISCGGGEWHFRPTMRFFGMSASTSLLYGQLKSSSTELHFVGRHPLGVLVLVCAVAVQQLTVCLAPVFVPGLGEHGRAVDIRGLASTTLVLSLFYSGFLVVGRDQFLRAVADIGELLQGKSGERRITRG